MKKWKNHPADTITLHRCTIKDNHDLWFLRYRVQQTDFFVTLGHFLSFYPTNNSKNQNSEKLKKCLEIPSFYTRGSNNHMQVWQVMDIRYSRWWIWFLFFILGYFLPFFTPSVPKIKIWKKMKTSGDIIILHIYTGAPKIMITWCTVPEIWWGMDRQTDRQKDRK